MHKKEKIDSWYPEIFSELLYTVQYALNLANQGPLLKLPYALKHAQIRIKATYLSSPVLLNLGPL